MPITSWIYNKYHFRDQDSNGNYLLYRMRPSKTKTKINQLTQDGRGAIPVPLSTWTGPGPAQGPNPALWHPKRLFEDIYHPKRQLDHSSDGLFEPIPFQSIRFIPSLANRASRHCSSLSHHRLHFNNATTEMIALMCSFQQQPYIPSFVILILSLQ